MDIKEFSNLTAIKYELIELLIDSVDHGASVGFLPPLSEVDAEHYWATVNAEIQDKKRRILIALDDRKLVGAVQISLPKKPNASHRAEVEKLMVHTSARGKGIARLLMAALETLATKLDRHLLVLDTRLGDVASDLYRKTGFLEAGQIPGYARSGSGAFDATVFFYKQLSINHNEN